MPDFGLGEIIAAAISSVVGAGPAAAATIGTIGSIAGPALAGAGESAALGAATGSKNLGLSALVGGVTGGLLSPAVGLGSTVGGALGIGNTAGGALVGAGLGAAGSAVTGGNPLLGAAEGGISGAASGLFGGSSSDTTATGASTAGTTAPTTPGTSPSIGTATAGGPVSAAAIAPQLGVSAPSSGTISDLTEGTSGSGNTTSSFGAGPTPGSTVGIGLDVNSVKPDALSGSDPFSAGGIAKDLGVSSSTPTPSASAGTASGVTPSVPTDNSPWTNTTSTWDKITGGIGKALDSNSGLIRAGTAGAGLLYDVIKGNSSSIPGYKQLSSQASTLANQGSTLLNYENTGTLPAGAQAALTQATASAKAAIRSQYAANGMSGSSAETQALNNVDLQASAQQFQIANQLAQQGVSETGLSTSIYNNLLQFNQKAAQNTSQAIGNLASAIASPTSTKTIVNSGSAAA